MNISDDLRNRVSITDHGIVEQIDPETGETVRVYLMTYLVQHEGVEYGVSLASSPTIGDREDVYQALLDLGTYAVLTKAGLR